MKQQNRNQLACLWLLLATLFLTACGSKERKPDEAAIKQAIQSANELVYENQADLAIARLEELEQQAPGDPRIMEALAFAYAKKPDPGMAALYFDQAAQLNPDNADLALYAAQAHLDSANPKAAAEAFQAYLAKNPTDAAAWKALARAQMDLKRHQEALNSFLEAYRQSRESPTHEEAALVGHLYHAVGNQTQATKWYMQALRPGGSASDRLTAQLGLFDIALSAKQWARAVEIMDQIETQFPGELASGPYASSRTELIKWRGAQNALQNATIATAISPKPPTTGTETTMVEETVAITPTTEPEIGPTVEELLAASESMPAVGANEVSVVDENAVAVVVPTQPNTATPTEIEETTEITVTSGGGLAVTNNNPGPSLGNLADPNDPAFAKAGPAPTTVDLTAELQNTPAPAVDDAGALTTTDIEVEESVTAVETMGDETVAVTETTTEEITETDGEVTEIAETTETTITETIDPIGTIEVEPPNPDMTLVERATIAYEAGDFSTAIRFYRQALATDDSNAQVAYELSKAYFDNRQYREAVIYASEATRLDPSSVRYTLNYLRAYQRTASRDALMRELVRAKERFPNSPDITLALGRAYEIIMGNTRNARFLYEEFVTMAPGHPRAEEIRQKLTRLPQ